MHTQHCLLLALECSNRAHSDLEFWISPWKLYFSSRIPRPAASRRALHGALAGRRIAGASLCTLSGRKTWEARRAPFSPVAGAGAAGASAGGGAGGASAALLNSSPLPTRLLPGWSERNPDAPPKDNVAIEEAEHFIEIVVKSLFGEVWFRSDC